MTNKPEMKGKARAKVDIQRRRVVKGIAASGAAVIMPDSETAFRDYSSASSRD